MSAKPASKFLMPMAILMAIGMVAISAAAPSGQNLFWGNNTRVAQWDSSPPFFLSTGTVRAVLFWSPDCRYCRQIVEQDLPPLLQPYGSQVQILYIDLNQGSAQDLYQAALQQYAVSDSGIPMLVIGDVVLQGSQIVQKLPGLIERHLAAGGVDWPAIPGLESWLAALPPAMAQPLGTAVCTECELTATRLAGMQAAKTAQRLAEVTVTPDRPVVRAVMFWMNGCPHCHEVLDKVLPPLQAKYGNQLQILLIELVSSAEVDALYALAEHLGIPRDKVGVPFLVIGEHVLIGSAQIPAELPGLIEQYLATGGVDLPSDPALASYLPVSPSPSEICAPEQPCPEGTTVPAGTGIASPAPTANDGSAPDSAAKVEHPAGFELGMATLVLLIGAVLIALVSLLRTSAAPLRPESSLERWAQLVLIIAGLGVAGYLAYVETQRAETFCGPIGDCNAVQQSPYARLFGVLPIGVLGVVGYLALMVAWLANKSKVESWRTLAALAMTGMAFFGTLFSIYLTALELFVIRAICIWCLSSAVIMAALLILSLRPAQMGRRRPC